MPEALLAFFTKLGLTKLFNEFCSMIQKRLDIPLINNYSWIPSSPLRNSSSTKNIKDHCKDIKLDFYSKQKRITNEFVEGQEAFIQHLIMFIATPKDVYKIYEGTNWGNEQALTIFSEKKLTEFQRQCEYMANCIIAHEHFKDYIQEIYSIKRKKDCIYIEMKLNGNPETVTCKIPNLNSKTQ